MRRVANVSCTNPPNFQTCQQARAVAVAWIVIRVLGVRIVLGKWLRGNEDEDA
jgi:hypothetical protein